MAGNHPFHQQLREQAQRAKTTVRRSCPLLVPALIVCCSILLLLPAPAMATDSWLVLPEGLTPGVFSLVDPETDQEPVFEPTTTTQVERPEPPDYDSLLARLNQMLDSAGGNWGVYVWEADTGKEYGINEDRTFLAASTNKLPLLLYVYRLIERGELSRDDMLTYLGSDYQEGTGTIQDSPIGTEFSLREVLTRLIEQSDNVAKNMLYRLVGRDSVRDYIWSVGLTDTDLAWANQTTPRDMGLLLQLLYRNQVVVPELTEEILDLMTGTEFEERLPKYLEGVQVAHKVGMYGDSVSDVGIVLGQKPYVICVYSEGMGSEEEAEETIAQISLAVYSFEASRE